MDYVTDNSGRHLLRLEQLTSLPDYVKQAAIDSESFAPLGDHLFADPARREFPCDTAGHTYLSHAYCRSANVGDPAVRERIKSAAVRHGITADLQALDTIFDGLEKSASAAPPKFAVEIDFGPGDPKSENVHIKAGGIRGFYPINTVEEIMGSAVRLGNDRSRIPLETFVDGCRNIVKAAQEQNLPSYFNLPRSIMQYGEERLPNLEYVEHEAARRATLTGDNAYLELSKTAADNVGQTIEKWLALDTAHGVKHSRSNPDPYLILNSGPAKAAMDAALDKWTLIEGAPVPKAAIAELDPERVTKHLAKAAADQVLALVKQAQANQDMEPAITAMAPTLRKSLLKLLAS